MKLEEVADLIAPLMPLTPTLPMSVSEDNRALMGESVQMNLEQIQAHTFPWNGIILLFILLMIVITLTQKPKPRTTKDVEKRNKTIHEEALAIFAQAPSIEGYIFLDQKARTLLQSHFAEELATKTIQEIYQILPRAPTLDYKTQKILHTFLQSGELVKFANRQPNLDDWKVAKSSLSALLTKKRTFNDVKSKIAF